MKNINSNNKFGKLLKLALVYVVLAMCGRLMAAQVPDGKPHKLELKGGNFVIDGRPFKLVAGEIHPVRVLPEFWEDRIRKARAMGLNTVSIYVMWNRIEAREGAFDFTGANDIRRFARLCQENGLWLIVRPGPYIGSEWDWGGFPAWLRTKDIRKLRGEDPVMQECFRRYITKVGGQLADLQIHRGGPILMVQVENEFRTSVDNYMAKLVGIFRQAGFDGQLFSNGLWMKSTGKDINIPDLLYGLDGMNPQHPELLAKIREVCSIKGYPLFCPEVYTSWFTHWGKKPYRKPVESEIKQLEWLFGNNVNFCYYVFHGGTSFGYNPEANSVNSYDYNAPVDEVGRITPKYRAIRDYLSKALAVDLPPIPPDPAMIGISPFIVTRRCALLDMVQGKPVIADKPIGFEHHGVDGGFVLYRTRLAGPVEGVLDLSKARTSAVVMLDGAPSGFVSDYYYKGQRSTVPISTTRAATLDILVQNHGRGRPAIDEFSGLQEPPKLDGKPLIGWEMFPLPLDNPADLPTSVAPEGAPVFYTGTFYLEKTGETYLDMSKFGHGFVWVNGHNLGRYWEVGPIRSLYLPSPWQKIGGNRITVLDLLPKHNATAEIRGTTTMIETDPIPFPEDVKAK